MYVVRRRACHLVRKAVVEQRRTLAWRALMHTNRGPACRLRRRVWPQPTAQPCELFRSAVTIEYQRQRAKEMRKYFEDSKLEQFSTKAQ